ncbi:MEDS domain-containing protein [Clostridium sp. LBM24168]
MVDKNIFGFHSSFYYFGLEHLYVSICQYIKLCIEKGNFICLIADSKVCNDVKNFTGIDRNSSLQIPDVYKIINIYNSLGETGMREKLLKYESAITKRGFKGLSFIIDVGYLISVTSKNDFLKIDCDITKIISNTKSSVICTYDFEDYIGKRKFIDDEIIRKSYESHPYRLYKNRLVNSEGLFAV